MNLKKLVDLDGLPAVEVARYCGYDIDNHGKIELSRFYEDIAINAPAYLNAICEARQRGEGACLRGLGLAAPHLIRKLEGYELLEFVRKYFSGLTIGPPWHDKNDLVQCCGYIYIDEEGSVNLKRNEFFEAFIQAEEDQESSPACQRIYISDTSRSQETDNIEDSCDNGDCIGSLSDENMGPQLYSIDESFRIVTSESNDEIDRSVFRLMEICKILECKSGELTTLCAVRVEYAGGGDEGDIVSLEYLCSPVREREGFTPFEIPSEIFLNGSTVSRVLFEETIREEAFSITSNSHGSWFNEIGGHGFLVIDLQFSTIHGVHIQGGDDSEADEEIRRGYVCPYFYLVND